MSAIHTIRYFLHFPLVETLGWTLVHFLWEGTAIGAMGWLFLRATYKAAPNVRYLLACGLMLGCVASPVITFLVLKKPSRENAASQTTPAQPAPPINGSAEKNASSQTSGPLRPSQVTGQSAVSTALPDASTQTSREATRALLLAAANKAIPWVVPAWFLGILFLGMRLCFGWCRIQFWRIDAIPTVDPGVLAMFSRLARGFRRGKRVRLLLCNTIRSPLTLGWLKPVILLPAQILTGLSQAQIEAVLAHEMAHIRRHDYLANLLQSTVEIVLFYHPVVWWLSRRVREIREECCDDDAMRVCPAPLAYAQALTALAEIQLWAEPAMAATGGSLLSRISRLLGRPKAEPIPGGRNAAWLLALAGILAISLGMWVPSGEGQTKADAAKMGDVSKTPPGVTRKKPFVNSLGMKFVPVPGTKVLFSIWDTRVQDYRAYAEANPGMDESWKRTGFTQAENHPVVNVSWNDAKAFCAWLTQKERKEGKIGLNQEYRLPTDAEWSAAVGPDKYPWGEQWPPPKGAGNYAPIFKVDDFPNTSPVGSFKANQDGLYDMGGNVWQWCEDLYRSDMNEKVLLDKHTELKGDGQGSRVVRGDCWSAFGPEYLPSSVRYIGANLSNYRRLDFGFRCVLASMPQDGERTPTAAGKLASLQNWGSANSAGLQKLQEFFKQARPPIEVDSAVGYHDGGSIALVLKDAGDAKLDLFFDNKMQSKNKGRISIAPQVAGQQETALPAGGEAQTGLVQFLKTWLLKNEADIAVKKMLMQDSLEALTAADLELEHKSRDGLNPAENSALSKNILVLRAILLAERLQAHGPAQTAASSPAAQPAAGTQEASSLGSLGDNIVERSSIMGLTVFEVKSASGLELRIKGIDANSAFIITGVKSKQVGKEINILATQGMVGFHGAKPGQSGAFDYTLKIPAGVDGVTFGKKKTPIWNRGTSTAKTTPAPAATPLIDDLNIRAF